MEEETIKVNDRDYEKEIAEDLYKQIYQKNAIGLPKTATKLEETINKITPDNVQEILLEYSELSEEGANLIEDLIGEFGIDIDKRNEYIIHIKNALLEYYKSDGTYVDDISADFDKELQYQKNKIGFANADYLQVFQDKATARWVSDNKENIKPNGKIDAKFDQGNTGDCWLLASIIAIGNTPKGKEILDKTVKVNDDGSVTVTLQGVNKTYTISEKELVVNNQLSTGDLDVRAIELAFNKYFYEERANGRSLESDGNYSPLAYNILTGEEKHLLPVGGVGDILLNIGSYIHTFTDEEIDSFNSENKVITVSAIDREDVVLEEEISEQVLKQSHAYAVIRSDSEFVYLVNPRNSGSEIKITREQFKEYFNQVFEMEL